MPSCLARPRSLLLLHLNFKRYHFYEHQSQLHSYLLSATSHYAQCRPHPSLQRRQYLSNAVLPPVIFTGLFLTLWTYKCFMMIIFQNKIIYMPFVPPGARKESIATYVRPGSPVQWEEYFTLAADGCRIVLCVGHPRTGRDPSQSAHLLGSLTPRCDRPRVVIFYFQGNASSLPPRLPALSKVLQRVADTSTLEYVLVAVSYRGYWKSSGRPSQSGIELDADAALGWAEQRFGSSSDDVQFMIWGQSIGAGVAARAVERWLQRAAHRQDRSGSRITQLVLETPFTSMRDMLVAVYPQKWLPYRYLWPFLRNWWDTKRALKELSVTARQAGHSPPAISIVQAGKDELVPEHHAVGLENVSRQAGLEVKRLVVNGALHTETMFRSEGIDILTSCLQSSERVSQTKGEQ